MRALHGIPALFYFQPGLDPAATLKAIGAALSGFGVYEGEPLQPTPDDASMLERGDVEAFSSTYVVRAGHRAMAQVTGYDHWVTMFQYFDDFLPEASLLNVEPQWVGTTPAVGAALWRFLAETLPRLILSTSPGVVCANGVRDEDETFLPRVSRLRAGTLPEFFTPLTYLGPDRLNPPVREWLAALPAFRSQPLGDGWMVQAVPDPWTPPTPEFLNALRAPGGSSIGYNQCGEWFGSARADR